VARLRLDLVVPAHDAAATLPSILDRAGLRELRTLVVVDRASTDDTSGRARDLGAVVLREPTGGYGAACLRALTYLNEQLEPPEVVAFAPGDAALDATALARLLDPIAAGDAELVIAGRPGARLRDRAVGQLIDTVYGHRFVRPGPIRAIRFPALVALGMSDRGDGWDVEMLVRALRLGVGIVEVDLGLGGTPAGVRGVRAACAAGGRSLFHILRHATVR
jgi:glycosyltransferase involved in cell wall biosynthesis